MHTVVGPPAPTTVITLPEPAFLAELAEADPHGIAASSDARQLTNAQLERSSSRLARALSGHGAGPGTVVALVLEPSIESVVAMWAVRKTGADIVLVRAGESIPRTARLGVTVSGSRARLPKATTWLPLDHPALMPEYSLAAGAGETAAA